MAVRGNNFYERNLKKSFTSVKQIFDLNSNNKSWIVDAGGIVDVGKSCKVTLSLSGAYLNDLYFFYSSEVSLNNYNILVLPVQSSSQMQKSDKSPLQYYLSTKGNIGMAESTNVFHY